MSALLTADEAYDVLRAHTRGDGIDLKPSAHAVAREQHKRFVEAVRAVQGPWNAMHEEMRTAILCALGEETEKKP